MTVFSRYGVNPSCYRLEQIFKGPPRDNCVKGDYKQRTQDSEKPYYLPRTGVTGSQLTHGTAYIEAPGSPDHEFGTDNRNTYQKHAQDISNQKSTSAMGACLIRKTPYIAKSDSRTYRSSNYTKAGGKFRTFVIVIHKHYNVFTYKST